MWKKSRPLCSSPGTVRWKSRGFSTRELWMWSWSLSSRNAAWLTWANGAVRRRTPDRYKLSFGMKPLGFAGAGWVSLGHRVRVCLVYFRSWSVFRTILRTWCQTAETWWATWQNWNLRYVSCSTPQRYINLSVEKTIKGEDGRDIAWKIGSSVLFCYC